MNYTITIDLNQTCAGCGGAGRVLENAAGLCLTCITAALKADVNAVRSEPHVLPAPSRRRSTQRGLAGILLSLIIRSERLADHDYHAVILPRGLTVEIGLGEQFHLRLSRADSSPSAGEWNTIITYGWDIQKRLL